MLRSWLRSLWRSLFRRAQLERELSSELAFHLEARADDLVARAALSPAEARRRARVEFGSLDKYGDEVRASLGLRLLDETRADVRHAVRSLRRSPGLTGAVVLTLAVGIGMSTAVFSIFNAVLLRPLAFSNPERLVYLTLHDEAPSDPVLSAEFMAWRERTRSFERLVAYDNTADETLAVLGAATQVRVARVTPDLWSLIDAPLALGNLPDPSNPTALVVSHRLFREWFEEDRTVVGRAVLLNGDQVVIAGVLPRGFALHLPQESMLLTGKLSRREPDVYRQYRFTPASRSRGGALIRVVGQLKEGVTIDQARTELEAVRAQLALDDPSPFLDRATLGIIPLADKLVGPSRLALQVLLAAVGLVLLIVCVNVANLLLARAAARQREMSVRLSLGARPGRLFRQLLTESALLALAGGALGIAIAYGVVSVITNWQPFAVSRLAEATIDRSVLLFSLAISGLAVALFGVGPALAPRKLLPRLKTGGATSSAGSHRARQLLVIAEVMLAAVLVTAAGLLLKSFWQLHAYPSGFEPAQTLMFTVRLTGPEFRDVNAQRRFVQDLLLRLQTMPGVAAVGSGTDSYTLMRLRREGGPDPSATATKQPVPLDAASEGFARALGLQLLAGRWLNDNEPEPVLVVTRNLARLEFGDEDPLGHRLQLPSGRDGPPTYGRIVGVVGDLKHSRLDTDPVPAAYMPYRHYRSLVNFRTLVKTSVDPHKLVAPIRSVVAELSPSQALYDVGTIEDALAESIAPQTLNLVLFSAFAAIALFLSLLGVYGVLSFSVLRRTPEIGIRMALGAGRSRIVALVIRQGIGLALAGAIVGLVFALFLSRMIEGLLYQVAPTDPVTFLGTGLVLMAAGLFASYLPARRASRVDPMVALRCE